MSGSVCCCAALVSIARASRVNMIRWFAGVGVFNGPRFAGFVCFLFGLAGAVGFGLRFGSLCASARAFHTRGYVCVRAISRVSVSCWFAA